MTTVHYQNKVQKKLGMKSTTNISLQKSGLIEACYDAELGAELLAIGKKHFFGENIAFICGVNHLLLKKAGMASKLAKLAGLDDGNMPAQMEQLFATYVQPTWGDNVVNVSHNTKVRLKGTWTTIKARQAVREMLTARAEIVQIATSSGLNEHLDAHTISKRLYKTLKTDSSPTDKEVTKRLDAQAVELLQQLDQSTTRTRSPAVLATN